MLSNTLKALAFPDKDYVNRITCIYTESVEVLIGLDFFGSFLHHGKNEHTTTLSGRHTCVLRTDEE